MVIEKLCSCFEGRGQNCSWQDRTGKLPCLNPNVIKTDKICPLHKEN